MAAICERIAEGESLRAVCRSNGMPNKATVLRWLDEDAALRDQYARAREQGIDAMAEETLAIADAAQTGEDAQVARVRIDARKWFASKLAPKKYGDKVDHEITGDVTVNVVSFGTGGAGSNPPT